MELVLVMEKPNLSIVMSGHMRSFRLTAPSFLELVKQLNQKYNCSLFIHTWDISDSNTATYYNKPETFQPEKIDEKTIREIYSPTKVLVEKQELLNDSLILHKQSLGGILSAEYSRFKSNELIDRPSDYTLCLRPDVYFYNSAFTDICLNKLTLCAVGHNKAASDVVYFAPTPLMNKVRQYFFSHQDYLRKMSLGNNEMYFLQYLKDNNIEYDYSDYSMPKDWKIIRSWWTSVDQYDSGYDRPTWDRHYG